MEWVWLPIGVIWWILVVIACGWTQAGRMVPQSAAAAPPKPAAPPPAAPPPAAEPPPPAPSASAAKGDLTKIKGIGPVLQGKLETLGITSLQQVAGLTAADIDRIDEAIDFKGRIQREKWVEQAKALVGD